MEKENNNGIGIVGCLQVVFIVLKLCKVINWSWLWVLSPLWISISISLIIIGIAMFLYKITDKE